MANNSMFNWDPIVDKAKWAFEKIEAGAGKLADGLIGTFLKVTKSTKSVEDAWTDFVEVMFGDVDDIEEVGDKVQKSFENTAKAAEKTAKVYKKTTKEIKKDTDVMTKRISGSVAEAADAWHNFNESSEEVIDLSKALGFEVVESTEKVVKVTSEAKREAEAWDAAFRQSSSNIREEAMGVEESLKGVSGATKEQQEVIEEATVATDNLLTSKQKQAALEGDLARATAETKVVTAENNKVLKLNAIEAAAAEGSYHKLVATYKRVQNELRGLSKEQRENSATGKELTEQAEELREEIEELNHELNGTGEVFEEIRETSSSIPGPVGQIIDGVKGLGTALKKLLLNPVVLVIVLIVAAIMGLVEAMKRTIDGQERLNKVLAIGEGVLLAVLEVITSFAIALFDTIPKALKNAGRYFKVFVNDWREGILRAEIIWNRFVGNVEKTEALRAELAEVRAETDGLWGSIKDLNTEMKEGFSDTIVLLEDLGKKISDNTERAKRWAALDIASKRKTISNLTDIAQLEAAAAEAHAKAENIRRSDADEGINQLNKTYQLRMAALALERDVIVMQEESAKLKGESAEYDSEEAIAWREAMKARINIESEMSMKRVEWGRQLNRFRTQALAQEKARLLEIFNMNKSEQDDFLRKNQAIMDSDEHSIAERFTAANDFHMKMSQLIELQNDLDIKYLEKKLFLELATQEDHDDSLLAQEKIHEARIVANREDSFDAQKKIVEKEAKFYQWLVNEKQKAADRADQIDRDAYDKEMFKADIKFELAKSEIDILRGSEEKKTQMVLKAEADRFNKILALQKMSGAALSKDQIDTIKNHLLKIEQEIDASMRKEKEDIWGLIGLNMDDETKEGIETSMAYAMDHLNQFLDAKIKAAEEAVKAADREVAASQKTLDFELLARANGYASSVAHARKERVDAEKTRRAALKEQKKFQKAQEQVQLIQQATNMITAASLIWSQVGNPAIALPLIAVMWGSFAATKIKAAQLKKDAPSEEYADGHIELLQGGSHASGNDVDLGTKPDGTRRRAEGGEYFAVINKRNSRKFGKEIPKVINSLNDGSFANKYGNRFSGAAGVNVSVQQEGINLKQIENDLRDIKDRKQRYTNKQGDTVELYKNLTRTVR